ncbi:MAG: two-component regulator propeller domain-containing protein [Bacteroidota bacterium]
MRKNVLPVICLLLLCSHDLRSQQYNFRNFGFAEGFTEAAITSICEDQYGNLWIGTAGSGLYRYDGHTFKNYVKADGLSSNFVRSLHYDQQNRLWIGTEEGLSLLENNQFSQQKVLQKFQQMHITSLVGDSRNQRIWIGTKKYGLYQLAGSNAGRMSGKQPPSPQINCLHVDHQNVLWIGTPRGVAKHSDQVTTVLSRSTGLYANDIRAIASDRMGGHWFGYENGGVDRLKNDQIRHFGRYQGLPDGQVNALWADQSGNTWIGTPSGISKFENGQIKRFNEQVRQGNQGVTSIYKDNSGTMWFGTNGKGLTKLDSERFVQYAENDEMGKRIYSITEAKNGNMIFASSFGGITVSDGQYFNLLRNQTDFTNSEVKSLFYSNDSTLWIGTLDDGAYKYDPSGFKNFSKLNGLRSNTVVGFATDTLNNIWMAQVDSGLVVMALSSQNPQSIRYITSTDGLSANQVSCITVDHFGHIWVGTDNDGLNKILITGPLGRDPLNILTYDVAEGLGSSSIKCILADKKNNVFVGTEGGGISILIDFHALEPISASVISDIAELHVAVED